MRNILQIQSILPGTVYVKIVLLNFVKRSFAFRNVVLEEMK